MEATGPTAPQSGPPPAQPRQDLGAGRIVAIILGAIAAIIGLVLLLVAAALLAAYSGRDDDGYYTTGTERLTSPRYALTFEDIDFSSDAAASVPRDLLGRVRVRAESQGGGEVFVGIGPEAEVNAYLRGVGYDKVEDLDPTRYLARPGGAPPEPPAEQRFWVASSEGAGRQAAEWEIEGGRWTVVAMNADSARRVTVETDVGARPEWIQEAGIGTLVAGLLLVGGGIVLIVLGARRPRNA